VLWDESENKTKQKAFFSFSLFLCPLFFSHIAIFVYQSFLGLTTHHMTFSLSTGQELAAVWYRVIKRLPDVLLAKSNYFPEGREVDFSDLL
jgi:hypothetical protein